MDSDLTIEQVYDGISIACNVATEESSVYSGEIDSAADACADILDMFEALGAQTVGDIMRMLERLEEVL